MKIYILEYDNGYPYEHNDHSLIGIFSSKEKRAEVIRQLSYKTLRIGTFIETDEELDNIIAPG